MPEMTLLGWFHTVLGVLALIIAFYTLIKYKIISLAQFSGKLYLFLTIITPPATATKVNTASICAIPKPPWLYIPKADAATIMVRNK